MLETINPACWVAFFESYIRDITHVWPLHPETLQVPRRRERLHRRGDRVPLAGARSRTGCSRCRVAAAIGPALADLVETFNDNVEKLNARMFTYLDYAVIGRKQPTD